MTGIEALGLMLNDDKITAIRDNKTHCKLVSALVPTNGISLTVEQITSDKWEIGYGCEDCDGSGEIDVPCPNCHGRSIQSLLENPCCSGFDEVECTDCNGEGIIWSDEY